LSTPTGERPPRLARGMYKKFLIGSAIIVALTTVAVSAAILLQVGQLVDEFNQGAAKEGSITFGKNELTRDDVGGPQTIMILGSDHRVTDQKGDKPHSDTILLIHLNPDAQATTIMSIPRDLRVDIPGYGSDKINAAYTDGGPHLTLKTVKSLFATTGQSLKINHVININFRGFRRAVDYVGCVYTDIDRRYYNPPGTGYATINIQPGYQRLCGQDALDYVRYRHTDSDLVRAARQQDFLRQAKAQIGAKQIFDKRDKLARLVGRYTQTDKGLHDYDTVLNLLKLVAFSAGHPVREVKFPAIIPTDPKQTDLTYDQAKLDRAVAQFMAGKNAKGPKKPAPVTRRRRHHKTSIPQGIERATSEGQKQAASVDRGSPFPVYYPKNLAVGGAYEPSRAYRIRDLNGTKHRAYRLVVKLGEPGAYYGIQGMNWTNPPELQSPDGVRTVNGRPYQLYFDGSHLRLVAWKNGNAVYWVTNTLLRDLSNKEMMAIATSLTRYGGAGGARGGT
jgi:polyisoprenyl-teichoic acid--peptidoglycan teichoic acid transferase